MMFFQSIVNSLAKAAEALKGSLNSRKHAASGFGPKRWAWMQCGAATVSDPLPGANLPVYNIPRVFVAIAPRPDKIESLKALGFQPEQTGRLLPYVKTTSRGATGFSVDESS